VRKHAKAGCQILCRTSRGLRCLAYRPTVAFDLRGFYIKAGQTAAHSGDIVSTVLLEPAGRAVADVQLEWIRRIGAKQGHEIVALMNRTLQEETTIGFPGPLDEETARNVITRLNRDMRAASRHVLVAKIDGVIVGQLVLTPNSTPNHRHIVELTRGTIDPSFRGAGLALLAFREVARKCEELGRELICLDVRAGSVAAMWWQHFGFKPYGLLPDYSRVGDKRYQGLYLYQTVADLKHKLAELGNRSQEPKR
jgi:ribosomal protein S18 acetylase RimI-like enzyme